MVTSASEALRASRPVLTGRGAAFFDLDGTLVPGTANIPLAREAIRAGFVRPGEIAHDLRDGVSVLVGSRDERPALLRDRVLAAVEGRSATEVGAIADRLVGGMVGVIPPAMRRILDEHAAAGRDRIVLSAGPTEIVSRLAQAAGLELGTGTTAETDAEGRYTGRLAGPFCHHDGKADVVRTLAEERGYDLAACFAYADSIGDLPMLELVGHPMVVNPEPELRELAENRGWPIVTTARMQRVSFTDPHSWLRLGQRLAAGTVGAVVSLGTRPVEAGDDLDSTDEDFDPATDAGPDVDQGPGPDGDPAR